LPAKAIDHFVWIGRDRRHDIALGFGYRSDWPLPMSRDPKAQTKTKPKPKTTWSTAGNLQLLGRNFH